MEDRYCPNCGKKTLRFIETCECDDYEEKHSWSCDCINKDGYEGSLVYIVEFRSRPETVV